MTHQAGNPGSSIAARLQKHTPAQLAQDQHRAAGITASTLLAHPMVREHWHHSCVMHAVHSHNPAAPAACQLIMHQIHSCHCSTRQPKPRHLASNHTRVPLPGTLPACTCAYSAELHYTSRPPVKLNLIVEHATADIAAAAAAAGPTAALRTQPLQPCAFSSAATGSRHLVPPPPARAPPHGMAA